jgi:hypothetical protein
LKTKRSNEAQLDDFGDIILYATTKAGYVALGTTKQTADFGLLKAVGDFVHMTYDIPTTSPASTRYMHPALAPNKQGN